MSHTLMTRRKKIQMAMISQMLVRMRKKIIWSSICENVVSTSLDYEPEQHHFDRWSNILNSSN